MTDPHELAREYTNALEAEDEVLIARLAEAIEAEAAKDRRAEEDRLNAPGALGRAALFYATHGFPVFPLIPGEKAPATGHGLKDASTDPAWVDYSWRRIPEANIGIRTGPGPEGCGHDVVDLDGPRALEAWFAHEDAAATPAEVLGRSRTTRPGGWHLWVPATGMGNRAGMLPSVDYRGAGGFVVAPPSRRLVDGVLRRWTWVDVPRALAYPIGTNA